MQITNKTRKKEKESAVYPKQDYMGDEVPTKKDFLIVIIVITILIALGWLAYYVFKLR